MLPTIGKWYTKTTAQGYRTERRVIAIKSDTISGDLVIYRELAYGKPQYVREKASTLKAWRRWAKDATESDKRLT